MKKGEIYVEITNEQERLRAIKILENAGEEIFEYSSLFEKFNFNKKLVFDENIEFGNNWLMTQNTNKTKITLDQLETLLKPKQSNLFIEVQEWIRENRPNFTITFMQDENPECFNKLKEHLQNDYPKGTEIKISANEILIKNNQL